MKKIVVKTLLVLSIILLVVGILLSLYGFGSAISHYHGERFLPFGFIGIALILYSVFSFAFMYLVEAAIIYIDKNTK